MNEKTSELLKDMFHTGSYIYSIGYIISAGCSDCGLAVFRDIYKDGSESVRRTASGGIMSCCLDLRRLVGAGYIRQTEPGVFKITLRGRLLVTCWKHNLNVARRLSHYFAVNGRGKVVMKKNA